MSLAMAAWPLTRLRLRAAANAFVASAGACSAKIFSPIALRWSRARSLRPTARLAV